MLAIAYKLIYGYEYYRYIKYISWIYNECFEYNS